MFQIISKNSNLQLIDKEIIKGDNGGYYVPSVSASGDLSWMPTEEDMPIPEVVNIRGTIEFDNLSEEQKQDIINGVLEALPNADEVRF